MDFLLMKFADTEHDGKYSGNINETILKVV